MKEQVQRGVVPQAGRPQGIAPTMDERAWAADS